MNQILIHHLVAEQDVVTPILFKPMQFKILQKLDQATPLTPNEQRYLRGKLGKKLRALEGILTTKEPEKELALLLNSMGPYYITGSEALKHNGYGWFYEPKIMEVINTKIEGKIAFRNKKVKFIRVKSLSKSKIVVDTKTSLHYASNDQIHKDITYTKNNYVKSLWMQMYQQYRKTFSNLTFPIVEEDIDFTRYGM